MKRHKYGVGDKSRRTADGIVFHSIAESKRYLQLKLLESAGKISGLELQPKFDWVTTYTANDRTMSRRNHYRADFAYTDTDTSQRIIEDVKGVRTREYKRKKRIVETLFGISITEI